MSGAFHNPRVLPSFVDILQAQTGTLQDYRAGGVEVEMRRLKGSSLSRRDGSRDNVEMTLTADAFVLLCAPPTPQES
jgi:hypothetical protein